MYFMHVNESGTRAQRDLGAPPGGGAQLSPPRGWRPQPGRGECGVRALCSKEMSCLELGKRCISASPHATCSNVRVQGAHGHLAFPAGLRGPIGHIGGGGGRNGRHSGRHFVKRNEIVYL